MDFAVAAQQGCQERAAVFAVVEFGAFVVFVVDKRHDVAARVVEADAFGDVKLVVRVGRVFCLLVVRANWATRRPSS